MKIYINGIETEAVKDETILQAARRIGVDIPTLCHDDRVKEYGGCGICVVEAEGIPKLLRSCSTVVSEGMKINTETKRARESRQIALELMLSDHDGDCRAPCMLACPGNTDCQGYVGLIANGEYEEALKLIKKKIPLPASIGRVCPHPCETACRRQMVEESISIAQLKAYVADMDLSGKKYVPSCEKPTGKKLAIVGGGPGGLSAAYFLRIKGHDVTVFDFMPEMGGMLRYGIPEYRLPKAVLKKEVDLIADMGVEFRNNIKLGQDITLKELKNSYDAVLIATGAWLSICMNIAGENLPGVLGGIDFLRAVSQNRDSVCVGKKVAVTGGGNTAMDACRTAVRLGAEKVYVIYRRGRDEMPADQSEII
ncbi:MAG: FAD-dependent oxidoreductase, partial [Clostridiales bacterium]|nr:FAD-dependent oxidoreductase [Clostridiales bacterium]